MKLIISGGGTGGHIYPALAIINELEKRDSNLEVIYVGNKERMEAKMIPELGYKFVGIAMMGFNRKNIFANIKLMYLLLKNNFIMRRLYKKVKPDIVVGTGGYVTVPVIYTASKLNIPTLIFDADRNLGKATKFLQNYATVLCTGQRQTELPSNGVYTSNPRGQYLYEHVERKDLDEVLFVFGSLGSTTVNQFFLNFFNNNSFNVKIRYVTGRGFYDDFVSKLQNEQIIVVEYLENIEEELANCKFVVCRGGATFVSELVALAIPAIYIPSPYVANNEQRFNVENFEQETLSLIIDEVDLANEFELKFQYMLNNYEVYSNNLASVREVDGASRIVDKIDMVVKKDE